MLTSEEKKNKASKKLIDISLFNDNNKKIILAFCQFNSEYSIIPGEPLVELVSNFGEIEKILKIDKSEIIYYLYFSRNKIHHILYDEEKEIQINYDEKNSISYYFYLGLLIMARIDIVNYKYNFEYIRKVFSKVKSINESHKYKIVIMSKLLDVLIDNFKGFFVDKDEGEEGNEKNEDKELKEIEEENNKIFNDNIAILEEINLNLEEINSKTIDVIYILIIIALIKLKKFENYDYTYNIIKELDLENIAITKLMFDELLKTLNENADYIKDYKITKKEDLFNEKKINFFYILLKYILKSPLYIYQIPLLFELKKFIVKIINSIQISVKEIKNDKLKYLLWTLMDSEYYFSNIPENDCNKLNEVLIYYNNFLFESKKEEITIITNILDNNFGKYKIYLNVYDEAKRMNDRYNIIQYLFENIKNKENKEKIRTEEQLMNAVDIWNNIENFIKNNKFDKIESNFADILLKFINENSKNKEFMQNIFSEDIINNFINQFTTYKKKDSNLVKSIMKEKKINSLKIKLCFLNSIKEPIEDGNKDPTFKLLSNYSDLKSILGMNHPQTTKFLYFNIEKVLEILYESNEKVLFQFKESKRSLSFYFYLNILLSENFDIPRFKFKQEYIRELQNLQTKDDKLTFAKLIRAKLLIELIDISNTSKLRFKKENKDIYDFNIKIIGDDVYCLNKVGIFWKSDDIIEKKIEEIYLEIIISLIKNKKFDDYQQIIEVMEQLEFEKIGLTHTMYEEISKVLYCKIGNDYKIENEKDLLIEKKINFYMIFFKYIFKDSYKVYHLKLFRDARENIKKIIKSKGVAIFYRSNFADKIKYILKSFNLPYEPKDAQSVQAKNNSNYFDSDRSILGYFDYNSSNYIGHNSNNNSSYVNSQDISNNNDSVPSLSSFSNILIQENDKSKNKTKKEIIINESKIEEIKEYFKNKDNTKSKNKNESSKLNILKYVNNFLTEISKKENKEKLENLQENILNSNSGGILDLFNLKDTDKDIEILKEIALNNKFQNLLSSKEAPKLTFNKVINDVFYFSEPIIDINDLEKNISKNSTFQINSNSITNFNEWINNYQLPSK